MDISLYPTPESFREVVRTVYDRDPVLFTLELTTLRAHDWPAGRILVAADDGAALGAGVQSADGVLLVSGMYPDWAPAVASGLAGDGHGLWGVRGTPLVAAAFAQAWGDVTGASVDVAHQEVLYRLGTLGAPLGVPGDYRSVSDGDTDLLIDWLTGFFGEAFGLQTNQDTHSDFLREIAASDDCIVLWTVHGEAVSMARIHAPLAGVARLGPIYTPPRHRGHGYAAAVTSAAVERARRLGATEVVLFADVTNLASNRVYRRIGFRPVAEHVHYAFRQ